MKKRIILFLTVFSSLVNAQDSVDTAQFHLEENRFRAISSWEYRSGDNTEWAHIDINDTSWAEVYMIGHSTDRPGNHWYRSRIHLSGLLSRGKSLMLLIVGLGQAYEIYWDGNLISTNGRVGQKEEDEIPGNIKNMITLREELVRPGSHTIAFRLSNHRRVAIFPRKQVIFGYITDWQAYAIKVLNKQFLMIGIYLTTVVLSLALYLGGGQHRSFLFVGVFCLTTAASYAVAPLIDTVRLSITLHDYIMGFQLINFYLTPFLFFTFFLFHFSIPRKRYHLGFIFLVALMSVIVFWPRLNVDLFTSITIYYSVGLLIYAVKRKKPGSLIALAGILFLSLSAARYVMQSIFHIGIRPIPSEYFSVPFLFCLTLSISQQIKSKNRHHTAIIKRSHRLETELLKKTIQPHFMMNTLTSIISLIGENPKKAVLLIKTLASEFRMINRISAEKLIPLREEIDLCRMHLELMGYRMDAEYDFTERGICEDATIPPMIFHTLVENGLTHSYDVKENGHFWLACTRSESRIQYQLRNDGSLLEKFSSQSNSKIEEGMGLKYVRARLEESYPERWDLKYGLNNKHWEVTITILG